MRKLCVVMLLALTGCNYQPPGQAPTLPASSGGDGKGIIGKVTQDIGEYQAEAGQTVSDGKIHDYDPVLGPMKAYGPVLEQVSKLAIEQNINLFHAEHGRYPKDHEEFMEEIIRKNNIALPVLPGGAKYQYDVENHRLIVIQADGAAAE